MRSILLHELQCTRRVADRHIAHFLKNVWLDQLIGTNRLEKLRLLTESRDTHENITASRREIEKENNEPIKFDDSTALLQRELTYNHQ